MHRYQFNVENLASIVQDNTVRASIIQGNGQILSVSSELVSKANKVEDIDDAKRRELSEQLQTTMREIEDLNRVNPYFSVCIHI